VRKSTVITRDPTSRVVLKRVSLNVFGSLDPCPADVEPVRAKVLGAFKRSNEDERRDAIENIVIIKTDPCGDGCRWFCERTVVETYNMSPSRYTYRLPLAFSCQKSRLISVIKKVTVATAVHF